MLLRQMYEQSLHVPSEPHPSNKVRGRRNSFYDESAIELSPQGYKRLNMESERGFDEINI